MKIGFGDATHIVAAYRLSDVKGPFRQGFIDDNEYGAAWRALAELKKMDAENIAVYIIRQ